MSTYASQNPPDRLSRRGLLRSGLAVAAAGLTGPALAACADERPPRASAGAGPQTGKLKRYDPSAPPGSAPKLPRRFGVPGNFDAVIAIQLTEGITNACKAKGIECVTAIANGDTAKFRSQAETMFAQGMAAWFLYPPYLSGSEDLTAKAVELGVMSVAQQANSHVFPVVNYRQVGRSQGAAAVAYMRQHNGGEAQVLLLNDGLLTDSARAIDAGIKEELKVAGGKVRIVSETSVDYTVKAGADAMATLLQAHPGINVILGHSAPVLGAVSVLEAKGRGNETTLYASGTEGGDDILKKIEQGGTLFRATWSQPWPLYGHAFGVYTDLWLQGRAVPRLVTAPAAGLPALDSPEVVRRWRTAMADPKTTFETNVEEYMSTWGNVSYDTRTVVWNAPVTDPDAVIDRE
ncbi:sugar ABC transporter substrate-binding protein [Dactylosporangium sucinum]|uniref:Periplasmic binding protein domain-containing protein n=1 Tax=Dactylosporangium sucinum TaxID=1424081 RepID=A0A917TSR6_9ACTN|nr:sugar ABC transporter substrate-binding protein [Dactylosporangium sucinum]GGM36427.1 hypothetical protein GCM10007977_042310 [Dactylosporangium sucinum]